jgi:hypothetical protein
MRSRQSDNNSWLCYHPIYQHGLKQPPLVFLNGGYSPFTLTRRDSFQAESVPLELIRSRPLLEVMGSLPFPVVGVPWYQYGSLADLTVIGHEIGHNAEADLQLTSAIENAIAGAVDDVARQTKWKEWASEVFADLYGVIAGGPAFVSALARFLAHENSQVKTPGYPPVPLRVRFNITVLTELGGCTQECANLAAKWNSAFPLAAHQNDYVKDLALVAAALLDNVSAGPQKMRDWMPITHHARAREIANKALNRETIKPTESFCALAAAVRLAYDEVLDSEVSADFADSLKRLDGLAAVNAVCCGVYRDALVVDVVGSAGTDVDLLVGGAGDAFADRLKRFDGLAAVINAAVVPDLRAGEAERPLSERTAAVQARMESAKLWLSALRGR